MYIPVEKKLMAHYVLEFFLFSNKQSPATHLMLLLIIRCSQLRIYNKNKKSHVVHRNINKMISSKNIYLLRTVGVASVGPRNIQRMIYLVMIEKSFNK